MAKQLLFSVTAHDCEWDFYRGSGKGGQKRNKTSSAVRCRHVPSGAIGQSEDGRSQLHNRQTAFRRMAETDKFKKWMRLETAKRTGELTEIERAIEKDLKDKAKIRMEIHDENGKWIVVHPEELSEEEV